MVAVFVSAAALNLTRPLFESWVASSVPMAIRGRYLGRRVQAIQLFAIGATPVAGFAAEHWHSSRRPG